MNDFNTNTLSKTAEVSKSSAMPCYAIPVNWVKSDVVYTPAPIVEWIIDYFKPTGFMLDPCCGEGAFYDKFSDPKDWCEIRKGRDFFDYDRKVDWIITNPPFTNVEKFMGHAFNLADDVVFILPAHKPFSSWKRMRLIEKYGGIKTILLVKGQQCEFPFRYPYGVFHFSKNYNGGTEIINCEAVTVGTLIAQRPPHRSPHEVFPHGAPRLYSLSQLTKTSRLYHHTLVNAFFAQHAGIGKGLKVR